jgi:hypothetical protein
MKHFIFGAKSLERLNNLEDITVEWVYEALKESDYDFSIVDGFRTVEQQNKMYRDGKSFLDGYNKLSAHQSGYAVDILPYVRDENCSIINCYRYNDPKVKLIWQEVDRAFLRAGRLLGLNVELGITYTMQDGEYDYPHRQINKV